jgi:hypothetical protein
VSPAPKRQSGADVENSECLSLQPDYRLAAGASGAVFVDLVDEHLRRPRTRRRSGNAIVIERRMQLPLRHGRTVVAPPMNVCLLFLRRGVYPSARAPSPDHMAVVAEMVHDARVAMDAEAAAEAHK